MESRNILLVVICICAFLVIIFGIGFVWSMPDRTNAERERQQNDENGSGIDIFEHVRDETEPPGLEPTDEPSDQMTLIVGEQKNETETTDKKDEKETVKDTTEGTAGTEKKSDTVVIHAPEEDDPAYSKTWIVKPQPTPIPARPTPTPKRVKRVVEYWIQAGSFKKKSSAEALNERLAEHGFQGQVKTRELKGVTYYRVRIGPYDNKKEAEKFLDWLKVLKGMEKCYISQVYTEKYVN